MEQIPTASCFNTQPPEGGWGSVGKPIGAKKCFNTQPPEGGWDGFTYIFDTREVSTHSRPKAAGLQLLPILFG